MTGHDTVSGFAICCVSAACLRCGRNGHISTGPFSPNPEEWDSFRRKFTCFNEGCPDQGKSRMFDIRDLQKFTV